MRSLSELIDAVDPAWPEVEAAVAAAPYPVVILAADPRRADEELGLLQVTTRSWLGAVVHRSGARCSIMGGCGSGVGKRRTLAGKSEPGQRQRGYGAWLAAMIGGAMTEFYESLRWPGWAEEVDACRLDQAISVLPPLWTKEGKEPAVVSRRPISMSEAMSLIGVAHKGPSAP